MAQGCQRATEPLAQGLRGEKFTGHLAKKDQEGIFGGGGGGLLLFLFGEFCGFVVGSLLFS